MFQENNYRAVGKKNYAYQSEFFYTLFDVCSDII